MDRHKVTPFGKLSMHMGNAGTMHVLSEELWPALRVFFVVGEFDPGAHTLELFH